ncbi:MAG: GFA family protein [Saccharospirillaceae bacterium]|nr:GFA family protein [Pseudomonadales bacterium]NRB77587.1 GFA family protein [Saccharospirillaceae bacterium]
MIGKCLCGVVQFEIVGELPNLYQCHCSLCRKVSGSSSNSAMLIESKNYKWICGNQHISSFARSSGFRSDFCSKCGSPVPNKMKIGNGYWVPVGLFEDILEETLEVEVAAHLYVGSKACWHTIGGNAKQYEKMPEISILNKILMRTSR